MYKTEWDTVKHFKPHEFTNPDMLVPKLIYTLDDLRHFIKKPIIIHCDYEKRSTGGYHPLGMALDIHAKNMHWLDLFLVATRFDLVNGIGCYPFWNNPGIHIDIRPKTVESDKDARWICTGDKQYTTLNKENIKKYI